jgi:hypothetical protein
MLPAGILNSEPLVEEDLQYRQVSKDYDADPRQDLTHKQIKEVGRTSKEWRDVQFNYFPRLGREYKEKKNDKHLGTELKALSKRRLDKWLPLLDVQNVVIGTGELDQLYPPDEVNTFAAQAGVTRTIVVKNATHNLQHFEPWKVSAFIERALDLKPKSRQADDANEGTQQAGPEYRLAT